MKIQNQKLLNVYDKLMPLLVDFAAQYVPPSDTPPELPPEGSDERIQQNEMITAISGLVRQAIECTKLERVGQYSNIELGKRMTEGSKFDEAEYRSKRSFKNLYTRYDGYAPIFGKQYAFDRHDTKINNRLANDFFGEIVNQKASFIYGTPALYTTTEANDKDVLNTFIARNNLHDLDMDTAIVAGACGVAYRYYWMDTDTLHATLIAPWDIVFMDFADAPIAIMLTHDDGVTSVRLFAYNLYLSFQLYDAKKSRVDYNIEYKYNPLGVPVVEYANNPQMQSHCHKAVDLMDAYDMLISDTSSEMAQTRLSYLLVTGNEPMDEEQARVFNAQLKASGTLHLSSGSTASYLNKLVDMNAVTELLKVIESNIYRFCATINYSSDKLTSGQITGAALKQRLQSIRNSCAMTWQAFNDANDQQWKLLSRWLQLSTDRALDVDAINVTVKYNIPVDAGEDIERALKMQQLGLPREVWLKELPIFEKPEDIERVMVLMDRDGSVSENELFDEQV